MDEKQSIYRPLSAEEIAILEAGGQLDEDDRITGADVPVPPGPIRLYLDDLRVPPDGWYGVTTVEEALTVLRKGTVVQISLDNDSGEGEREGYELALWMREHNVWPYLGARVHSDNASGIQNMIHTIANGSPYRKLGMNFLPSPQVQDMLDTCQAIWESVFGDWSAYPVTETNKPLWNRLERLREETILLRDYIFRSDGSSQPLAATPASLSLEEVYERFVEIQEEITRIRRGLDTEEAAEE